MEYLMSITIPATVETHTNKDIITTAERARKALAADGLAEAPELRLQNAAGTHREKEINDGLSQTRILKTRSGALPSYPSLHPGSIQTMISFPSTSPPKQCEA